MMARIAVVEPDARLARALAVLLKAEGYGVSSFPGFFNFKSSCHIIVTAIVWLTPCLRV